MNEPIHPHIYTDEFLWQAAENVHKRLKRHHTGRLGVGITEIDGLWEPDTTDETKKQRIMQLVNNGAAFAEDVVIGVTDRIALGQRTPDALAQHIYTRMNNAHKPAIFFHGAITSLARCKFQS